MTPYIDGVKLAGEKLALSDAALLGILHALPIPGTSLGAAVYEGATSPDDHYIRRPLVTTLGGAAGGILGGGLGTAVGALPALATMLSNKNGSSDAAMLMGLGSAFAGPIIGALGGTGLGAYLAHKSQNDE